MNSAVVQLKIAYNLKLTVSMKTTFIMRRKKRISAYQTMENGLDVGHNHALDPVTSTWEFSKDPSTN